VRTGEEMTMGLLMRTRRPVVRLAGAAAFGTDVELLEQLSLLPTE
jgi:hypothetical protein